MACEVANRRLRSVCRQLAAAATSVAPQLLAGIRVVDLSTMVAAPSGAALLADHGADVIKIENPAVPDMPRRWGRGDRPEETADPRLRESEPDGGGGGSAFTQFNRGKRCVALDPTKPEGLTLLLRLLETADVFVTNVRSRSLVKMGLDYETLAQRFPKLIYGHLTAFGRAGPLENAAGYDFGAFWAHSGVMDTVRSSDDASMPRFPGAIGDNLTGSLLFGGILGALYHRERTGQGQLVDAALLRTGIWSMNHPISSYMGGNGYGGAAPGTGIRKTTDLGKRATDIIASPFRCADGVWLQLLGLEFSRHLPKLLAATGLRAEALFGKAGPDRETDWAAATRVVDAVMATRSSADWETAFREHDVWYARVNSFRDMPGDEQAKAIGAFVPAPALRHSLIGSPVVFSGVAAAPARGGRAPGHGEHTDEVLHEDLGILAAELRRLRDTGIIR